MNELQNKINELTSLYNSVLNELNQLTEESFNEKLTSAKKLVISANNLKEELFSEYNAENLQKYASGLNELAKQIKTTYDNIIVVKKSQISAAAIELKNLHNKKKIAVYER